MAIGIQLLQLLPWLRSAGYFIAIGFHGSCSRWLKFQLLSTSFIFSSLCSELLRSTIDEILPIGPNSGVDPELPLKIKDNLVITAVSICLWVHPAMIRSKLAVSFLGLDFSSHLSRGV